MLALWEAPCWVAATALRAVAAYILLGGVAGAAPSAPAGLLALDEAAGFGPAASRCHCPCALASSSAALGMRYVLISLASLPPSLRGRRIGMTREALTVRRAAFVSVTPSS